MNPIFLSLIDALDAKEQGDTANAEIYMMIVLGDPNVIHNFDVQYLNSVITGDV